MYSIPKVEVENSVTICMEALASRVGLIRKAVCCKLGATAYNHMTTFVRMNVNVFVHDGRKTKNCEYQPE